MNDDLYDDSISSEGIPPPSMPKVAVKPMPLDPLTLKRLWSTRLNGVKSCPHSRSIEAIERYADIQPISKDVCEIRPVQSSVTPYSHLEIDHEAVFEFTPLLRTGLPSLTSFPSVPFLPCFILAIGYGFANTMTPRLSCASGETAWTGRLEPPDFCPLDCTKAFRLTVTLTHVYLDQGDRHITIQRIIEGLEYQAGRPHFNHVKLAFRNIGWSVHYSTAHSK
jgi:hypothetical protein